MVGPLIVTRILDAVGPIPLARNGRRRQDDRVETTWPISFIAPRSANKGYVSSGTRCRDVLRAVRTGQLHGRPCASPKPRVSAELATCLRKKFAPANSLKEHPSC